jgi:crotonobetaine/carnitine-CoA ligase
MSVLDLWSFVVAGAEAHPDRVAVAVDAREVTWAGLVDAAERGAAGLAAAGVRGADVVCHFSLNDLDAVITMLALVRLGAVECPVNAGLRGQQLSHVLHHSGATTVIADGTLADRLTEAVPGAPGVQRIVGKGEWGETDPSRTVPVIPYEAVRDHGGPAPARPAPHPGDPFNIVYTSGTTGPAKGAVLPSGFPVQQARIKIEAWGLGPSDVLFTALPLYHVNARFSTLATALVVGGRAAIRSSFSAVSFWSDVRQSGATEIGVVGAVANILMLQTPSPADRNHRARMMHGAAGMPISQRREFEERFGLRLVTGFAMTETGHISTTSPDDPGRYLASGRPVPQFEVAIVDELDQLLAPGVVGELVVRPRMPYAMMTGYHNEPAATLEAFRNLWFHTGDLAKFDEHGYLHWVDRKKDAIRRRGEMISSTEVEKTVLEHPSVAECAVVGVPSALGEEDVKLVVVGRTGAAVDPQELARFCAARLPDFAVPRYVQILDELPKGPTHKVEKAKLRDGQPSGTVVDLGPGGAGVRRAAPVVD